MLEHLFGSKTRVKLLQLLLNNTDKYFYVREMARLIDIQLNAVRREIENLEKVGLIKSVIPEKKEFEVTPHQCKYYQIDTVSLLYPEFRDLFSKAQIIEEREFINELNKKGGKIKFMLLTGCFTGDLKAESDMLLVGDLKGLIITKIVKKFETSVNREIRYTLMSEAEFTDRREVGDRFLYSLLEAKNLIAVDEYRLIS